MARNLRPAKHYHCHVGMHLSDDASRFEISATKNVWVLVEEGSSFQPAVENMLALPSDAPADAAPIGFELTFMMAEKSDLDELAEFQKTGVLPTRP